MTLDHCILHIAPLPCPVLCCAWPPNITLVISGLQLSYNTAPHSTTQRLLSWAGKLSQRNIHATSGCPVYAATSFIVHGAPLPSQPSATSPQAARAHTHTHSIHKFKALRARRHVQRGMWCARAGDKSPSLFDDPAPRVGNVLDASKIRSRAFLSVCLSVYLSVRFVVVAAVI